MTAGNGSPTRAPERHDREGPSYLRKVDLFGSLSAAELRRCERALPMKTVTRGRVVSTPSDPEEALYILKEGAVRLFRLSPGGREVTIGTLGPGDVFGTMPMCGGMSRNTFAEAATEALVCRIAEDDLRSLIRRHPDIAINLLRVLGVRLAAVEDLLEDLAFRSAGQRVARAVLRLLDGCEHRYLDVSHEDLGKSAGVARETVTKTLRKMERAGWIATGYRRLEVLDRAGVEAAARD